MQYTVRHAGDSSILVAPQTEDTVDLEQIRPAYSDIPEAEDLKAGDVFELFYPYLQNDGTWQKQTVEFVYFKIKKT